MILQAFALALRTLPGRPLHAAPLQAGIACQAAGRFYLQVTHLRNWYSQHRIQ